METVVELFAVRENKTREVLEISIDSWRYVSVVVSEIRL